MSEFVFRKAVSPLGRSANRKSPVVDRFWSKVRLDRSCLIWTGHRAPTGYGQMGVDRKVVNVHRWAYEYFVGPIPEGLHIDHICGRGADGCVNPAHLEAVTQAENNRRAWARRPIPPTCRNGHPKTERGDCRRCMAEANRRYRARKKEAAR